MVVGAATSWATNSSFRRSNNSNGKTSDCLSSAISLGCVAKHQTGRLNKLHLASWMHEEDVVMAGALPRKHLLLQHLTAGGAERVSLSVTVGICVSQWCSSTDRQDALSSFC